VRTEFYQGCFGIQGALSAFFEITGDRLRLASKAFEVMGLEPEGVIDVDGDGSVEVIFKEGIIHGGVSLDRIDRLFVPSLDCEC
jgi:hypothetical protein